jgi:hypothetical protein
VTRLVGVLVVLTLANPAPDISGIDQALWPLPFAVEAAFYLLNYAALLAGVVACLWLVRRAEDEGGSS